MRNSREIDFLSKITLVIAPALLAVFLCGCDLSPDVLFKRPESKVESPEAAKPANTAISVIDINGDVHEASVDVIEETESEEKETSKLPERSIAQVAQNIHAAEKAFV